MALRNNFESVDPIRIRYGIGEKYSRRTFFRAPQTPHGISMEPLRIVNGMLTELGCSVVILAPHSVKPFRIGSVKVLLMHMTGELGIVLTYN